MVGAGRPEPSIEKRRFPCSCFCTTSERWSVMGGGERGEVSCAELDVGGAARVQLEGGLGKQLGEGACIALAKRSCLFGCLAMGRGEAILTTGGAPSGALAYGATVTDATRFCLAPGTTGVFGLRGMGFR